MCTTTQHARQIVINYKVDITLYKMKPKNMSCVGLEDHNNRLYPWIRTFAARTTQMTYESVQPKVCKYDYNNKTKKSNTQVVLYYILY